MPKPCPCTSGLPYADCCRPLHRGERPAGSPEALMRARFAAFALGDAPYLWRTLHSDHEDRALPEAQATAALREASRRHRYMRLSILGAQGDEVLFLAGVFERGQDRSFVERSRFALEGGAWRYLSGVSRPAGAFEDAAALTLPAFEAAICARPATA